MRFTALIAALAAIAAAAGPTAPRAAPAPAFEIPRDDVLVDEAIAIAVTGLAPDAAIVIRAENSGLWTSSATFTADAAGRVDLPKMAPTKGRYKDADAMGLFWSAERGAEA